MIRLSAGLALAVACILLSSNGVLADIDDPGSPTFANGLLNGFVTPTVNPGETVDFSMNLTNTYDKEEPVNMTDIRLTVGIYMYSTSEESKVVDEDFPHPPLLFGLGIEQLVIVNRLEGGETVRIEIPIHTESKTPHGSPFLPSTYFVRFRMDFEFEGNTTTVVLQSRGFFTDEQWDEMVSFEGEDPIVNRIYMKSLGVDGLIPDSSFGLKVPIPRWPLWVLIIGCVGAAGMALYYYVIGNPGRHPKLEKRFYNLRGKLSESWSKLKDRRRK